MWSFLYPGRLRPTARRRRRPCPTLEPLEDRVLLSQIGSTPAKSSSTKHRASSIALSRAIPSPPPPAVPRPSGGQSGPGAGAAGRVMPGALMQSPSNPLLARPSFVAGGSGDSFRTYGRNAESPAPQVAFSGRSAAVMHSLFADPQETFQTVDVSGDLSFVDDAGRRTEQAFAALLTNTRVRPDVVPQQGSSVASVATLMPSDRDEPAEAGKANDLAILLIDTLGPVRLQKTRETADMPATGRQSHAGSTPASAPAPGKSADVLDPP